MYRISELAELVGLSRTSLLYYEKLGLIEAKRLGNGYRNYSDQDAQRLRIIQQLQAGGLTLKECKACLDAKINRQILLNRLSQLDDEIAHKQQSRKLLAALLGEGDNKEWHEAIDKVAPDAHLDWLITQGFNEKEALRLKWLSKNMNEHENYMADFMRVYEPLERWGPGLATETIRALTMLPFAPKKILEVGCGNGVATTVLAQHSGALLTAVDNDTPALNRLEQRAKKAAISDRVTTVCASMSDLLFEAASFDVIWSEGSAYIMGVRNALKGWKPMLKQQGVLVFSDLVWLTSSPSKDVDAYWQKAYPDMTTVDERLKQAELTGYNVRDHFTLSEEAWEAYYAPLEAQVKALREELQGSAALQDIEDELNIYRQGLQDYGYQMFILQAK
ncbi:MAG: MerR family transcriptional regulator [Motiliproteus sp.]|nr:MerR family transcriptional regulator [Motiliproteus sp.]MCW9052425.1 MerR family transcriptional regulator [Motiliproteus sp.]